MSAYVERIVERLRDAEDDLKQEVQAQQRRWRYQVHRGRVWFDEELRAAHKRLRQSIPAYVREGSLLSLLTAPVIYSLASADEQPSTIGEGIAIAIVSGALEADVIRVQDVMTKSVRTVPPTLSAEIAWREMHEQGVHHLVVMTGTEVLGVFSDRDAGGVKGERLRTGRLVEELMTKSPVTVRPETPVRKAANVMRGRSIGSLVVTDAKGRLRGIVTVTDLLELIGRGLERPVASTTRWTLNHQAPHKKMRGSAVRW
jgi:CBS domain-containing protein